MNVAVIGALGFVGSHLVDALKDAGHWVWGVDNESQSGQRPADSRCDQIALADAADLMTAGFAPKNRRFDVVIHAASPAGPARIAPGYALRQIITLTHVGLEFAAHHQARFIKLSTSECYGRADAPLEETTPAIVRPDYDARSEYQIGFLAAEQLCFSHPCREVQVLRLFNATGPRQDASAGVVLPRFCQQALAGGPLTVFGSGSQRRAFMDVSDLTAFVLALLERWPDRKTIFNVASPRNTTTILGLAHLVINLAGSPSRVVLAEGQAALGAHWRDGHDKCGISINRALQLGWTPRVELDEIVGRTLAWQRAQRQAAQAAVEAAQ